MASSAFSFHCMICFEEFDPQTNYPVVLPCGHTYVCVECANRLDKCMECRTPLTMKMEVPPPAPGAVPGTPGPNGGASAASASGGLGSSPDVQKENVNSYADRVRNSPGFRRRYGHLHEYNSNNNNNTRGPSHAAPKPPPQPVRLPLPKNAVLLSLIQASEPARRGAEVEAPPTPQKTKTAGDRGDAPQAGLETPSPGRRRSGANSGTCPQLLPKLSRSSPLFLDGSSSGDLACNETSVSNLVGSVPGDEDHKIRVGTYLEGGPCGTYAVAAKKGLLVYPTLFEHTLPSSLSGLRQEEDVVKRDVEELVKKYNATVSIPALEDLPALAAAASEDLGNGDGVFALNVSLTVSEDESDEAGDGPGDVSARILPVRRSVTVHGAAATPKTPLHDVKDDCNSSQVVAKKFARHFSQGSCPKLCQRKKNSSSKGEDAAVDEFDRPLIRLSYGDRVQVVSMDKRGWVKLARGYGYIRLENDKQLVKVGGSSDKACQIEAMLHELSLERNRLKQEQTKLERLSAGLMIDLQSSLITSDDKVVVSAPEGSLLRRCDSDLSPSLLGTGRHLNTSSPNVSLDDIDISNRSKSILSPSHSSKDDTQSPAQPMEHQEIRTTQSHSPGRMTSSLGRSAPPTPPYGQGTSNAHGSSTPMRVDFRTGLSGHRALTSSHSHPHDFIESRGTGTTIRSMSNHAGISMNVFPNAMPHSFWESPCAGGI